MEDFLRDIRVSDDSGYHGKQSSRIFFVEVFGRFPVSGSQAGDQFIFLQKWLGRGGTPLKVKHQAQCLSLVSD